jgi:uroporphyrin-III C-methyltransferase
MTAGLVWFVGAGPGDPELMTLRGWRLLREADVVFHDALVNPAILRDLSAELVNVGKRCGRHSVPQEKTSELLVASAKAGRRVVRLKGGDPGVLGRVGEEALELTRHGIAFEIVPGVSSATSVPCSAGIPVTHRGLADSFVVVTAHRQCETGRYSIPDYAPQRTLILLMAGGTVADWRPRLLEQGYPPDLPVAVISAGWTPEQQVIETSVSDVAADMASASLPAPVMVVVGWVVTLRRHLGQHIVSGPCVTTDQQTHSDDSLYTLDLPNGAARRAARGHVSTQR